MWEPSNEDHGSGQLEGNSDEQRRHSEALAEWRSSDQVENGFLSTLPFCLDVDEFGSKHSELYGKHTWKIEKYSKINKHWICSDVFYAGGYNWYIVILCDVCNLSLYLCLANHEEFSPGWSHFAQFTIALVNKDPKKSIYSDTIHRFWRGENYWEWNKFIQLPKLQEGYIDDLDSLIIKAQIQVIRESMDRPLRCLSSHYRRELVRVHLPNLERICWRFMEVEIINFLTLMQDKEKWLSFHSFWSRLDQNTRHKMSREKMDVVLNLAAKIFFAFKHGTSTLMMDSLYSGWKAIEGQNKKKKNRQRQMDNVEFPAGPAPMVSVDQDMFVLVDDLLILIQRAVREPFPMKEEKSSQNPSKVGDVGEEYSQDAMVHDESRLTELGRRTMEMIVLAHILRNKVGFAYEEHIALIRQEQLIHEEEEEWVAESKQKAKRGTTEKEKKSKKKQGKKKKNKKEKRKEEKVRSQTEERDTEEEESVGEEIELSDEKPDTLGESSPVHCELDAPEIHNPPSEDTSRGRTSSISSPNGVAERNYTSVYSDESVRSGVASGSYKRNVSNWQTKIWRRKGETQPRKMSGANSLATETEEDEPSRHASNLKSDSHSSETRRVGEADVAISRIQEAHNPREHNLVTKDSDTVHRQEKSPAVFTPPKASPWNLPSVAQAKPKKRGVFNEDTVPNRKAISPLTYQASPSRAAVQNATSPKPSMSRSLPAPTILPKLAAPSVSAARTSTTSFTLSVSTTGRVSSPTHTKAYIPQSYKHAIVGSSRADHLSSQSTGTSALLSVSNQSGFPINVGSAEVSSSGLLWTGGSSSNRHTTAITISGNHRQNDVHIKRPAQSLMTNEFPHLGIINDLLEEEHGFMGISRNRVPQWLNDVYSLLADVGISGRSRSYTDGGFYQSYSEYMPGSSSSFSSSLYGNSQMDGLTQQTQWQLANMDLSSLAMRSQNNASQTTYRNFDVNSSNPNLSAIINCYRPFRPSNRN